MRWGIFVLLLSLDIITKVLASRFIPFLSSGIYPFGGISVFDLSPITFSLNLLTNSGTAWGFFQGNSGLLFSLRLLITLVLLVVVYRKKFHPIPISLIFAGAIGNQIDYLAYGHVIDFIHFTFWGKSFPIFNIADSCITLAVFFLLLPPKRSLQAT